MSADQKLKIAICACVPYKFGQKAQSDWRDIGVASSCYAFAIFPPSLVKRFE